MGCSAGVQSRLVAELFPKSSVHGCDISEQAINRANHINENPHLPNLSFSVKDVHNLPSDWTNKFDLVLAFNLIHDLPYASRGLVQIHKSLKPKGKFLMFDMSSKQNPKDNPPLFYMMSLFHCMTQSLYFEGSQGLGICWGNDRAKQMFQDAGFSNVRQLKNVEHYYLLQVGEK